MISSRAAHTARPAASAAWAKAGLGRPIVATRRQRAQRAIPCVSAQRDDHAQSFESARSQRPGRAGSCRVPAGVGLLAGGAQRLTAATNASLQPQAVARHASTSAGWQTRSRYSAGNRKSPDRSPVKTRPVRLPPCAAGARPTISTRAWDRRSRAPAAPSTSAPRSAPADVRAASSRHATRRGHRTHSTISASIALELDSCDSAVGSPDRAGCRPAQDLRSWARLSAVRKSCSGCDVQQRLDGGLALLRGRRRPGGCRPCRPSRPRWRRRRRPPRRRTGPAARCPHPGCPWPDRARTRAPDTTSGSTARERCVASVSSRSTSAVGATRDRGDVDAEVLLGHVVDHRPRVVAGAVDGARVGRQAVFLHARTRPGRWCPRSRCRARSRSPSSWSSPAAGCGRRPSTPIAGDPGADR